MPRYICKVSNRTGQKRITIPTNLVSEAGLNNIDYVELIMNMNGNIVIRRIKTNGKETTDRKNGVDRQDR